MRLLILFALFPLNSHAVFQKIYQGFQVSKHLEEVITQEEVINSDQKLGLEKNDWNLTLARQYSDSYLNALFSFQSQQTITNTTIFGLEKRTFQFGTFSLQHQQIEYDLSRWETNSLNSFSGNIVYEARNTLNYSYEILDRSQSLDLDIIQKQYAAEKATHDLNMENKYYDFYIAYISAKSRIVLDRLYKAAEKKAKKRVQTISRRLKDGLSRKHELEQAKLSYLTAQENTIKNFASLRENVLTIENVIGVSFDQKVYALVTWTKKDKGEYPFLYNNRKLTQAEQIERLNKVTLLQLEKFKNSINHKLSLNLSYSSNSFDENSSEAISNATPGRVNDEHIISLKYTFPIGPGRKSAENKKLLAQKNINELKLRNTKSSLLVQIQTLEENIDRYFQTISLSESKIKTAQKSLSEHSKLYPRGHVSFEEFLRAEEALINTKISRVNALLLYEQSLANLAFLTGNIKRYLDHYRD